jgi:hypothetical protein
LDDYHHIPLKIFAYQQTSPGCANSHGKPMVAIVDVIHAQLGIVWLLLPAVDLPNFTGTPLWEGIVI